MSSVFEMWFYVGFKSYLGFFFPRILRHEKQKGFWSTVIIIFFNHLNFFFFSFKSYFFSFLSFFYWVFLLSI